jgi:hypothetical protein
LQIKPRANTTTKALDEEMKVTATVPALEKIVKPNVVEAAVVAMQEGRGDEIKSTTTPVAETAAAKWPPELIPIGSAAQPVLSPQPLSEGVVVPELVQIRRGPGAVAEIPALAIKPRDIHAYVIIGCDEYGGGEDLHGIYLPEQLNTMPGSDLSSKLSRICLDKFNSMTDATMSARRNSGNRVARNVTPQNGNAMNLIASLEIVDDGKSDYDGDGTRAEPHVCYVFKVVKYKMNSLGVQLRLSNLP